MFKNSGAQGEFNGFLDKGSRMQGELRFDNSFRIDGRYSGKIESQGRLVVGEGGEVEGDVHVRHVLVSGVVRGSIHSDEQIHLAAGSRVMADLTTPSLVIEDGAIFEGNCTMTREGREAESPQASLALGDEGTEMGPKLVPRTAGEV
jgi:cytoskeletal protein CcmA (bactofilin family)